MVPKVSPVLPQVAKLLALAGRTMLDEMCIVRRWDFLFFPVGTWTQQLQCLCPWSWISRLFSTKDRDRAGRPLHACCASPGNSLRCVLHKLLSTCSRIISVGGSTASETPAQCLENGNIQTYRVVLEPIGRSLWGSCAAGCACSAVKPRCSCRRWTKRGGQLSWVRLFLSCRQLSCAQIDGVQCTTTVLMSCSDLYTKHTRACTTTHTNTPRTTHV